MLYRAVGSAFVDQYEGGWDGEVGGACARATTGRSTLYQVSPTRYHIHFLFFLVRLHPLDEGSPKYYYYYYRQAVLLQLLLVPHPTQPIWRGGGGGVS